MLLAPWYPLFKALDQYHVDYIVAGSMAALLHGAPEIQPKDLDIVPRCEPDNLQHLAELLHNLGATTTIPEGHWIRDEHGEWRWQTVAVSDHERATWRWQPDPEDWHTFDHAFSTSYGQLDCVPQIAGQYHDLIQRATFVQINQFTVPVVSIADLLTRLTVPRRTKDVARVQHLRSIQRQHLNNKE